MMAEAVFVLGFMVGVLGSTVLWGLAIFWMTRDPND